MKKKILIAVIAVICLLSMVLAGCSNIKIENVDEDVIGVLQDAIKNSETNYSTYYIREKINSNPKNIATNERTEYMLNVQADDKSIEGVNNTKINFSIKYTKGITESTDTFIFGQSLPKNVKAKSAQPNDYKWYVFENYKVSKNAPVFTKDCNKIAFEDTFNFRTSYNDNGGRKNVNMSDYTMSNVLARLKALTKDDIKVAEKGNVKQGKITTYVFEVTNKNHEYSKWGELKVLLYTDKKETRVMSVSSTNEEYTLDVMYQGPKIDIPNYDNFKESDNQITLTSDRSDGLVALYDYEDYKQTGYINAVTPINPLDLAEFKIEEGEGENKVTYSYKVTTVESAVNWDYEYTEIIIKLVYIDKDGKEIEYSGSENIPVKTRHYLVQTKNIVKTKKDLSSMIPLAAAVVALIALLVALMALFKIKKQNKELTRQIKALSGETEEEIIIDAEVEQTEQVETIQTNEDEIKETTEDNAEVKTEAEKTEDNAEVKTEAEKTEE